MFCFDMLQPYQPWVHSLQGVPTRLPPQEPGTPPGQATDSRHLKICVAKQTGPAVRSLFFCHPKRWWNACAWNLNLGISFLRFRNLVPFCSQASRIHFLQLASRGLSFVLKKPSIICGTNSSPNSLVPLYKLALEVELTAIQKNKKRLSKTARQLRQNWISLETTKNSQRFGSEVFHKGAILERSGQVMPSPHFTQFIPGRVKSVGGIAATVVLVNVKWCMLFGEFAA